MTTYSDRFGYFQSVASFIDIEVSKKLRRKLTETSTKSKLKCLKCDQLFLSEDRALNRICGKCKRSNEKYHDISGIVNYLPKSVTCVSYIDPLLDDDSDSDSD